MNTPTQKALIQFAESIIITAFIAGVASLSNVLIGNGQINWQQASITFGFAVLFSLAHSISAYLKAIPAQQNQPDLSGLGTVLDAFLANLEQRFNTVKAPAAVTSATVQPPATTAAPVAQPSQPAQIDWSATNPAFKAVNLVPPTQQQ
jgi:hypothetical protein